MSEVSEVSGMDEFVKWDHPTGGATPQLVKVRMEWSDGVARPKKTTHTDACLARQAVRDGPAGDEIEAAVDRCLIEVPSTTPRPSARRYSRNNSAAYRALRLFMDSDVTSLNIEQRQEDGCYRVEAEGTSYGSDEKWTCEGESDKDTDGETACIGLAICRMILNTRCDDDCLTEWSATEVLDGWITDTIIEVSPMTDEMRDQFKI